MNPRSQHLGNPSVGALHNTAASIRKRAHIPRIPNTDEEGKKLIVLEEVIPLLLKASNNTF